MAAPSNIRINPFIGDGGTTNYVDFTEVHIIPAVSPFVVRLNEVPQKKDPSNMKVVYVDETTGAPTTTVLTEVAATPGAGEFRPDYSTNADGDEDWNTGLIEFSSADAGKIIQVSYTGMGTLAGVKNNRFPAWWLDRGDGSDGDFRPTGNTTISGLKQYRSVFIPAGVTVTCSDNLYCKVIGSFINNGNIIVTPSGGMGGVIINHAGVEITGRLPGNGGASAGGAGHDGFNSEYFGGGYKINYPEPFLTGAGGGSGGRGIAGGRGGGNIVIACKGFRNQGIIQANGGNGETSGSHYGGGGGGGGCVIVACTNNNGTGTLLAQGGQSGNGGANGSNGITKIIELKVM